MRISDWSSDVCSSDLSEPREKWPYLTVDRLMVPCTEENTVDPGMDAIVAMALMNRTGSSRLLVSVGDRLVGIVVLKDMLELLSLQMDLEWPGAALLGDVHDCLDVGLLVLH